MPTRTVYAVFEVSFSGKDLGNLPQLQRKLLEAAQQLHPEMQEDDDVEVTLMQSTSTSRTDLWPQYHLHLRQVQKLEEKSEERRVP